MHHLPTPTTDAPYRIDGPLSALHSAFCQLLFWFLVLVLAGLDLGLRFSLLAIRLAFRIVSGILVYLVIATLVIGAVILMFGFHSAIAISGNSP